MARLNMSRWLLAIFSAAPMIAKYMTRFQGTGPNSAGPVPESQDRSHKNDFYEAGPIQFPHKIL